MAVRDSWPVTIADGDQLDDGFFNDLKDLNYGRVIASDLTQSQTTSSTSYATLKTISISANDFIDGEGMIIEVAAEGSFGEATGDSGLQVKVDGDIVGMIEITQDSGSKYSMLYLKCDVNGLLTNKMAISQGSATISTGGRESTVNTSTGWNSTNESSGWIAGAFDIVIEGKINHAYETLTLIYVKIYRKGQND